MLLIVLPTVKDICYSNFDEGTLVPEVVTSDLVYFVWRIVSTCIDAKPIFFFFFLFLSFLVFMYVLRPKIHIVLSLVVFSITF